MSILLQDLKYGIRLLLKTPAFTVTAALSLALGIGANTTIFTLVNAVLLNPLPVEQPSRLASVFTADARNQQFGGVTPISDLNFRDYRDRNAVFSGMTAYLGVPLSITGGTGEPQQVFGELVTGSFFDVLGVKALLGRTFLPEEDRTPGSHLVVVLSHNLWQMRFGGDRSVVGRYRDAEQPVVHRRWRDARGVQGRQRDRRAGVVGAVHDLPGHHRRLHP
jgi:hypothetical protein